MLLGARKDSSKTRGEGTASTGSTRQKTKNPRQKMPRVEKEPLKDRLGLLDEAGLDRLDRDPDALRAAVGQLDPDPLEIGAEFALRDAGHVRADAAALLGL